MKHYTEIINQIEENEEKVTSIKQRIAELCKDIEHRHENDSEITECKTEIKRLEIANKILSDNARLSAIDYLVPVFTEVIKKYKGKQYGKKTMLKIAEEMKERTGIAVYLHEGSAFEIRFVGDKMGNYSRALELFGHYGDHGNERAHVIQGNKIMGFNPEDWQLAYCSSEYVDDVTGRVYDILSARGIVEQAYAHMKQACDSFNRLLPSSIDHVYPETYRGYFFD